MRPILTLRINDKINSDGAAYMFRIVKLYLNLGQKNFPFRCRTHVYIHTWAKFAFANIYEVT